MALPVQSTVDVTTLENGIRGAMYGAVMDILGNNAVILPIGDTTNSALTAATFATTLSDDITASPMFSATFTWSEALALFDTEVAQEGVIPIVTFNGTDEGTDTPDADYWSAGADGTAPNEPSLSFGAWLNPVTAVSEAILAKNDNTSGSQVREWMFYLTGGAPQLQLVDESTNGVIGRKDATNLDLGAWSFVVATYDGSAADSGFKIDVNGVQTDDTDTGSGSYTAMENTATIVTLANRVSNPNDFFFDGEIAGGPLGPFFVQGELSAKQVANLYELGRRALNLG